MTVPLQVITIFDAFPITPVVSKLPGQKMTLSLINSLSEGGLTSALLSSQSVAAQNPSKSLSGQVAA